MTRDDIIRMALEAGLAFDYDDYPDIWQTYMNVGREEIERFAALVAAAEREACAKVCELEAVASSLGHKTKAVWQSEVAGRCAAAIRARGEMYAPKGQQPVPSWAELQELHDKVVLLQDELSDMDRTSFAQMEIMRQALAALEGVVSAHSYESGTPVEAIAALRKGLGEGE